MSGRVVSRKTIPTDPTKLDKVPYGDAQQIMNEIFGTVSLLKEHLERLLQEIEQINRDMQLTTSICTRCAVDPKVALLCLQRRAYVCEQALTKIAAHLRLYGFFQGETRQLLAELDNNEGLTTVPPHQRNSKSQLINPK